MDVGAGVGLGSLDLAWRHPGADLHLFEACGHSLGRVRDHLVANRLDQAAVLYRCRIGPRSRASGPGGEPPVIDWLGWLGSREVAFLRMALKGGEGELLADERFGAARIRRLAMEWWLRDGVEDPVPELARRLEAHGFEVRRVDFEGRDGRSGSRDGDRQRGGIVWGRKP